MGPVRVVVVEDSALQRAHLVDLLTNGGSIVVVGQAGTVEEAVAVVLATRPDVVTMDLEIPGGRRGTPGGIVAIEALAAEVAVPILVLSAHAATGADTLAIQALDAGAADVFPKAPGWDAAAAATLRRRVALVSRVPIVRRRRPRSPVPRGPRGTPAPVVGIAASTGGPSALREVVGGLADLPAPVLVVQHIHPDFARSFAAWLGQVTGVPTALATEGDRPLPGHVYVAPPDVHLRLAPGGGLTLSPEPDLLSRPSADELLRSIAAHAGAGAVGVILTGMGDDGARGLLAIRGAGGATVGQDTESSVVDGMPRVARDIGAVETVVPLEGIAREVRARVQERVR